MRTGILSRSGQKLPSKEARYEAAIELASESAGAFRRTARRYSLCSDDAEDAYQRALEILLMKAPTDNLKGLRAWLHTVVKHEALAIRKQRERLLAAEPDGVSDLPGPHDQAPSRERVRQAAEALSHLKHSEAQCMLLKALGYSYEEIADRTGYSWTKVNRSLSEGRQRFFERFDEVGTVKSCERSRPLVLRYVRGAVSAVELKRVESHLAGCERCRSLLRDLRAGASEASRLEVFSPALLLASTSGAGFWSRVHSGAISVVDRVSQGALKAQQGFEAMFAQKAVVAVASTAVVAGGVAIEQQATRSPSSPAKARAHDVAMGSPQPSAIATPVAEPAPPAEAQPRRDGDSDEPAQTEQDRPAAAEFDLGAAAPQQAISSTSSLGRQEPEPVDTSAPTPQRSSSRGSSNGKEFMP